MAKRFGLTPNEQLHVDRVNTAHVLGDQAPPEMRYLALQGPQLAQTSSLATAVENLSRRFEELVVAPRAVEGTRDSVKTLAANKEKYPYLSKAIATNPKLLESRMAGRTGTAEDIAKSLEDEAAEFATAYGVTVAQPASDGNAAGNAQSAQGKPAPLAGTSIGDVPPLPGPSVGPMTDDEDKRIQAELKRKYNL